MWFLFVKGAHSNENRSIPVCMNLYVLLYLIQIIYQCLAFVYQLKSPFPSKSPPNVSSSSSISNAWRNLLVLVNVCVCVCVCVWWSDVVSTCWQLCWGDPAFLGAKDDDILLGYYRSIEEEVEEEWKRVWPSSTKAASIGAWIVLPTFFFFDRTMIWRKGPIQQGTPKDRSAPPYRSPKQHMARRERQVKK
jgi:hypothetical protein